MISEEEKISLRAQIRSMLTDPKVFAQTSTPDPVTLEQIREILGASNVQNEARRQMLNRIVSTPPFKIDFESTPHRPDAGHYRLLESGHSQPIIYFKQIPCTCPECLEDES